MVNHPERKIILKIQTNQTPNMVKIWKVEEQRQELKGLPIIQRIHYLLERMNMELKKLNIKKIKRM